MTAPLVLQSTVPGPGAGPGDGGGVGGAGPGDGPTVDEHCGALAEPTQIGSLPVQQIRAEAGTAMVSHATGNASEQHIWPGVHTG